MTRKRRKKSIIKGLDDWYMLVFLGMIVFFIAITSYPTAIGLDPSIGVTLTKLFPSLFLACIAAYMLIAQADKTGKFGGMMFLGLALCLFLGAMDAQSLITVDMFYGLSLIQTQIWIMALSVILGALVFASK